MKRELLRFTFTERLVHWAVGISFALLLLTGLSFSYPRLFWLTAVVGGGPAARVLHVWTGFVFSVALACMVLFWLKDMYLERRDIEWLRAVRHYARHVRDKVPAAGKYNGGQKAFFWAQAVLGVIFLATGIPLWLPDAFGGGFLIVVRLIHYVASLAGGLLLIVHIYLATVGNPGTARAMLSGTVSREWARVHHPLWHDEQAEG